MGYVQRQLKSMASIQFNQNWTDTCKIKDSFVYIFIFPVASVNGLQPRIF